MHLELEADELRREGLSEEAARRKARCEFGNVRAAQEQFYLKDRWVGLDSLFRDIRFALRSLGQSPGLKATAVMTLALGIGANTAIFTLVHAILLRDLPVVDPKALVRVGNNEDCCILNEVSSSRADSYSIFPYETYQVST